MYTFCVVNIDIGSTTCGYAFSTSDDYRKDPFNLSAPLVSTQRHQLVSTRFLSAMLLNADLSFHSFGWDASDLYDDLSAEDKQIDYFFFCNLQNQIFGKINSWVNRDTGIEDTLGLRVKALVVFRETIQFLKRHFLNLQAARNCQMNVTDIFWVITVPNATRFNGQQFARDAALQAGIPQSSLLVATGPEALTSYSMHILRKETLGARQDSRAGVGNRFMTVDVGDFQSQLVTVTVYEVLGDDMQSEVESLGSPRSGEIFGQFIIKLIGKRVYDKFASVCPDDLHSIFKGMEAYMTTTDLSDNRKLTIKIPASLIEIFGEVTRSTLGAFIKNHGDFKSRVKQVSDKLRVDAEVARQIVTEPCAQIAELVRKAWQKHGFMGRETVVFSGQFAGCRILQETFVNQYPDARLVFDDPDFAFQKGSVMLGHRTIVFVSRAA